MVPVQNNQPHIHLSYGGYLLGTLQGINISHLGKKKHLQICHFLGICDRSLEGISPLKLRADFKCKNFQKHVTMTRTLKESSLALILKKLSFATSCSMPGTSTNTILPKWWWFNGDESTMIQSVKNITLKKQIQDYLYTGI